jgi:hypothetical protein
VQQQVIRYRNAARGTPDAAGGAGQPKVAGSSSATGARSPLHAAWADMLAPYFPDGSDAAYVTFTWSDEYSRRHHVHGAKSAIADVQRFLGDLNIRQWFLSVEQTDRLNVPHVHGIIRLGDSMPRRYAWEQWWASRKSLARILPVQDGCLSYVTKYVLKDQTATTVEWRLG